jgi:PP-loop superfamily ATP-utilizing enzyme
MSVILEKSTTSALVLFSGGQDSANLAIHKVDATTGALTFTSEVTGISMPVSIEFVK